MRRGLSFLLLIPMILCSVAFTAGAADDILNETFEQHAVGDAPKGWIVIEAADGSAEIAPDSEKGKALNLDDKSKSKAATVAYKFPRQTEALSVSYDLKDPHLDAFTRLTLRDGETIIAQLATSKVGEVVCLYYIDADGTKVPIGTPANDVWYNVKLNLNLKTGKFDVYYNGELRDKGIDFSGDSRGMDEFRLETGKSYINSVFLDNVVITDKGVVFSDESKQADETQQIDPDAYVLPTVDEITTDHYKGVCWAGAWSRWKKSDGTYDERGLLQDMEDIKYAGIHWSRIQLSLLVDPVEVLDERVDWVYNNGLEGLGFIPRKRIQSGTYGTPEEEAQNIADIKMLVNRYKDRIKYWEIGNEPNLDVKYWDLGGRVGEGGDDPNSPYNIGVENFYKWMRDSYIAVKEVQPDAVVILAGMSSYKFDTFMIQLTKLGIYEYCDEVALHPYGKNAQEVIDKTSEFKRIINTWPGEHSQKPIWITEIGYSTNPDSNAYVATEEVKARYLTLTYQRLVDWMLENQGVIRPILYYTMHEGYGTFAGCGLVNNYLEGGRVVANRLPALYAMRVIDDVNYEKSAIPANDTGQVYVYINGKKIDFDVEPMLVGERVFVPMRTIFETLGAAVEWTESDRTAKAALGAQTVSCTVDSLMAAVNGKTVALDERPFVKDNRMLVPVRFVSEGLNARVTWDAANTSVVIRK